MAPKRKHSEITPTPKTLFITAKEFLDQARAKESPPSQEIINTEVPKNLSHKTTDEEIAKSKEELDKTLVSSVEVEVPDSQASTIPWTPEEEEEECDWFKFTESDFRSNFVRFMEDMTGPNDSPLEDDIFAYIYTIPREFHEMYLEDPEKWIKELKYNLIFVKNREFPDTTRIEPVEDNAQCEEPTVRLWITNKIVLGDKPSE